MATPDRYGEVVVTIVGHDAVDGNYVIDADCSLWGKVLSSVTGWRLSVGESGLMKCRGNAGAFVELVVVMTMMVMMTAPHFGGGGGGDHDESGNGGC